METLCHSSKSEMGPYLVLRLLTRSQLFRSACNQSSSLLRLPAELLIEIFEHVGLLDQIALAIACKRLLQVSTLVPLKISSMAGQYCDSGTMEKLLKIVQPLNEAGRAKMTWIVCLDCFQWRPRKKSYWTKRLQRLPLREIWNEVEVIRTRTMEERWYNRVQHWNCKSSLQCPECWYHEEMREMSKYLCRRCNKPRVRP